MQLISASDIFNDAKSYLEGRAPDGSPHPKDLDKSEALLNELLTHNLGHPTVMYVLGSLYAEKGFSGLAVQILSNVVRISPAFGEAWNNLGLAYKGTGDWAKAAECAAEAAKHIDHPDIACNVSGMHLNRGMAETALKWADEALARDPAHTKAKWHKGMALLELRRFDEGWDFHEARLDGGANENIAERNYHKDGMTPWWDGKSPGKVVIHGEQGMGDEIMFASCIRDAIDTGAEIILEPSPRLEKLFKRSFPECKVYGTDAAHGERWIDDLGEPDFKCAMGSLPKFYRRHEADFPGTPYLKYDRDKAAWWSDKLKALGPAPKIGLAWQGGVQTTRYDARSFHPVNLHPLFEHDVNWVSLQYDPTAQDCVQAVRDQLGVKITHWPKAVEARDPESGKLSDLDELAALISRLDLVITVCQTAVHIAGALGVPCWCLTPNEPSWRYGNVESSKMPWYASVNMIRQKPGEDWGPAIETTARRLGGFLEQSKTA